MCFRTRSRHLKKPGVINHATSPPHAGGAGGAGAEERRAFSSQRALLAKPERLSFDVQAERRPSRVLSRGITESDLQVGSGGARTRGRETSRGS